MKNLLRFVAGATSVAFFFAGAALAQTSGTVTNHAFAIGKGAGVTGFASLLCATTQIPVGQTSADPICRTVTGDVTISASGVTAIGAAKVTNSMIAGMTSAQLAAILSDETGTGVAYFVGGALGTPASGVLTNATGLPVSGLASQAAYTFVGNATGSSAVPTAVDIAALTTKASPAASDYFILSDQAASGAWKKATVSSVGTASGISSIAGNTGAFTLSGGVTNLVNDIRLSQSVNAQTGTSYTLVDGDRAKIVTASNAAAQAYTLPQAGASSVFQSGWFTTITNKSTLLAGIVTITPTTSTIFGLTSIQLAPGDSVCIVSDGTNYQSCGKLPTVAFYVHKNGTAQTGMLTGAYDRVTWSTATSAVNAALSSNRVTIKRSGFLTMSATAWWTAHAASSGNPTFLLKIIVNSAGTCNGSDVFAGNGSAVLAFAGTANAQANGTVFVAAGDVLEVCAFGTSDDALNDLQLDGNLAHVHWSGYMQ